jgi:hypothetical protein
LHENVSVEPAFMMSTVFAESRVMSRQIFWKSREGIVTRAAERRLRHLDV